MSKLRSTAVSNFPNRIFMSNFWGHTSDWLRRGSSPILNDEALGVNLKATVA